jgi:hypothetical protein
MFIGCRSSFVRVSKGTKGKCHAALTIATAGIARSTQPTPDGINIFRRKETSASGMSRTWKAAPRVRQHRLHFPNQFDKYYIGCKLAMSATTPQGTSPSGAC